MMTERAVDRERGRTVRRDVAGAMGRVDNTARDRRGRSRDAIRLSRGTLV
jgi:hypothetical protein